MLKKSYFNLFGKKLLIFTSFWPFNQLLNVHKTRGPKCHVVFSPKKNCHELQLHQNINTFPWILAHGKIIAFSNSVSAIFEKDFGFNLISVLVFFQKYAMTSVHKNPKICVNIHYFTTRGHSFLLYEINLLCWKFQSNRVINVWVGARQS